jgi:acyl-CoA synthetase (NDP forming)
MPGGGGANRMSDPPGSPVDNHGAGVVHPGATPDHLDLDALFRPRSVAVVGASATPGSFGHALVRGVAAGGFSGAVYLVNPGRTEIAGLPCWPALADLPACPDCALLAVADAKLEAALEAVVASGIPAAVVFGGMPDPTVDGPPLPARLRAIAAAGGVTLLGGNAMGFFNYGDGLFASGYQPTEREPPGGVAIVSHSGSAFSALANARRGLRPCWAISPGQELVVSVADCIRFLVRQPETRVVGLFLETVRDPAGFAAALAEASAREIPMVALKVGRTERGRELALAHSGALAGSDAAFAAFCDRHGVHRVRTLDELANTLELLAAPHRPRGGRLALAGDSGGERALIVDLAADLGVDWAALAPETTAALVSVLEPGLEPANPLDLWGSGRDWEAVYDAALAALAADPEVGLLLFAVDLISGSRLLEGYVGVAERAADLGTPFAVMGNLGSTVDPAAAARLRARGIPVLLGTENGLAAAAHALAPRPAVPVVEPLPAAFVERWAARLEASAGAALSPELAGELLADLGVPMAPQRIAATASEAVAAAADLGWPVVMKTSASEIAHKSDGGGVLLGIADEAGARAGWATLTERFGPPVLVQRQVTTTGGAVELLLGLTIDPQFGPLLAVGLGGVWVEALGDVAHALAPVDEPIALALLVRLRGARLLDGFRGAEPTDRAAAARAIAAFSRLAALAPWLDAAEVNPLIVGPNGAVAVDALVIPKRLGAG